MILMGVGGGCTAFMDVSHVWRVPPGESDRSYARGSLCRCERCEALSFQYHIKTNANQTLPGSSKGAARHGSVQFANVISKLWRSYAQPLYAIVY